jgi:hypothetical protein
LSKPLSTREPLGYRIKENSDAEDLDEVMTGHKPSKTTHSRLEIAQYLNRAKVMKVHRGNKHDPLYFVPYSCALQVAIANSFGNKSLFNSDYKAYKMVKKKEMTCIVEVLKRLAKETDHKADYNTYLLASTELIANPMKILLGMKLVLLAWKRYLQDYLRYVKIREVDLKHKDSIDIESCDFELEEFKEANEKTRDKKKAGSNHNHSKQNESRRAS